MAGGGGAQGDQISRKVILVLGPESSGTRLATRILIEAGCLGDDGHVQRWDTRPIPDWADEKRPIVWRRSLPHGGRWPDLYQLVARAGPTGRDLLVVVTVREWWACARSQVRAGHVPGMGQALSHISLAYLRIFSLLAGSSIPYYVLPYEALVLHPGPTIAGLIEWLGLARVPEIEIRDENAKHYGTRRNQRESESTIR